MPERFEVETSSPGYARIAAPRWSRTPIPSGSRWKSQPQDVQPGSTLTGLVDEALAEFADFTAWEIVRTPTEIGGEPAVVVEPIPGLLSGRALYFLHGGAFYRLYFWPVDIESHNPTWQSFTRQRPAPFVSCLNLRRRRQRARASPAA